MATFGKREGPHPAQSGDSFRMAFRTGLLFCLIGTPALYVGLDYLPTMLDRLVSALVQTAHDAPSNMPSPRSPLSIPLTEWLSVLIPAGLCAFFFCLAHVGAKRIVSGWHFVGVAIVMPLLLIVIGSPIYALFFNAEVKGELNRIGGFVIIMVLNPLLWGALIAEAIKLLGMSFAWIHAALPAPPGAHASTVQMSIFVYLALAGATWTLAALTEAYATARVTMKMDGTWRAGTHGILRALAHPLVVLGRLAGLVAAPERTRGQRVAHAIASPWMVPALCTALFFLVNRIPSLFPLLLVGFVFFGYGVALAVWRLGDAITMTDHEFGGAIVGFLATAVVGGLCFVMSIQIFTFARPLGGSAKLAFLASYLPSMLTLLASLVRGVWTGWRAGDLEAEYTALTRQQSAASRRA